MRFLLAAMLVLFCANGTAGLSREQMLSLNALGMQMICLQQGPAFRESQLGQQFTSQPGFPGWAELDSSSEAQCLKKHQWMSEEFCKDLMSVDALKDSGAVRGMLTKHQGELPAAEAALDYNWKVKEARSYRQPEPQCPTERLKQAKPLQETQGEKKAARKPRSLSDPDDEKAARRTFDEMHERWAVADKTKSLYVGRKGKDARQMLNASGYDCAMIVQPGQRVSESTGMPAPADLPAYRCIKEKEIPAICSCIVVRLELTPQVPTKPSAEYGATIDATTLTEKDIDVHCASTPSSAACWRPN